MERQNVEMSAFKLMEAAEKIGAHFTTINGWFKELENRGIHYLIRDKIGDRIFLEDDIEIGKHIVQMREKKTSLPAIYESLGDFFDLRPKPEELNNETSLTLADQDALEALMKTKQFNDFIDQIVQSKLTALLSQHEIAASNETKKILLDYEFTKLKVENQLKKEAEEAWQQEPNRMKKIALFWSVEDSERKQGFITKFITDRIEERLKKVMNNEGL